MTKETCISAKEPYTAAKETYIARKETNMCVESRITMHRHDWCEILYTIHRMPGIASHFPQKSH